MVQANHSLSFETPEIVLLSVFKKALIKLKFFVALDFRNICGKFSCRIKSLKAELNYRLKTRIDYCVICFLKNKYFYFLFNKKQNCIIVRGKVIHPVLFKINNGQRKKIYNKIVFIPSTFNLTCEQNKVYYIFKILKKRNLCKLYYKKY